MADKEWITRCIAEARKNQASVSDETAKKFAEILAGSLTTGILRPSELMPLAKSLLTTLRSANAKGLQ